MEQLLCEELVATFFRLRQRTFGNSHFNRSGTKASCVVIIINSGCSNSIRNTDKNPRAIKKAA